MLYSKLLSKHEHLRYLGVSFSSITLFIKSYSGKWKIRNLYVCSNDYTCMANWNYDRIFYPFIRELNEGNYIYCYILLINYNSDHKAKCKTRLFNSLQKMKL